MGDVVNLRRARKARARIDKAMGADANRARFGRTKAQKQADKMAADRQARQLAGARREEKDLGDPDKEQ